MGPALCHIVRIKTIKMRNRATQKRRDMKRYTFDPGKEEQEKPHAMRILHISAIHVFMICILYGGICFNEEGVLPYK